MVNWSLVKSLLFTLGPLLLPKAIAFIRSIRASSHRASVRPCPRGTTRALNILFIAGLVALLSTFPYFQPENIFLATTSRLQIPTDVLFTRLAALQHGALTSTDEALKNKFVNLESRLLYLKYGPQVLASCSFCHADENSGETSYQLYALPSLAAPHLVHLTALGLATSGLLFGAEAARWRTPAAIAALGLALAELWLTLAFDHRGNARATRLAGLDCFHWRMCVWRGVGMAAVDAVCGWVMWLAATNRLLVQPATVEEQVENSVRGLATAQAKLAAQGWIRNAVFRDRALREQVERYWTEEGRVMAEVQEEKEVVDGMREALQKINVEMLEQQAKSTAEKILGSEGQFSSTASGLGG
ncbi:MAG: hypothetical protein M1822_003542 [Bathelium mastoideum]|nr:MAG: hypothetical protein M1822_003542 [Bathelium mastoideum]